MTPASLIRTDGLVPALDPARVAGALAIQARTLPDRVWRVGAALASAPLTLGGVLDADDGGRLAWLSTRGMSEDRLDILCGPLGEALQDAVARSLLPSIVQRRRACGDLVVLATDLPERIARSALQRLAPDEILANRLELRGGRATGRLHEPLVSARLGGSRLKAWCAARDLELDRLTAFASRDVDTPLLASVGHPCAVHPDRALRQHALRLGWPVETSP